MRKLKVFLSALLITVASVAFAQNITVKGVVTDASNGEPLSGAAILVKGTPSGTVADNDGRYSISVSPDATLGFTTIGFKDVEIEVQGRTEINASLEPDTELLDEVVVTAVGIQRSERSLGYAVTKIDSDETIQKAEPDLLRSLDGKVAGVQISAPSGDAGSATRVTIRGNSSFLGNNQPLYVVDGVPYSNEGTSASGRAAEFGGAYGSGISTLDPNDIESISVLKGAASAVLYGSRAANGVVLITTKSGSKTAGNRRLGVTYSGSYSIEKIASIPHYQNSYGQGSNFQFQGSNGSWGAPFTEGATMPQYAAFLAEYPDMPETIPYQAYPDNVKNLFRNGQIWEHSVSLQSNNDKGIFNATASFLDQKSYIPGSNFNRYSFGAGGQQKLGWGLRIGANLKFSYTDQDSPMYGNNQSGSELGGLSSLARAFIMPRSWDIQNAPYETADGSNLLFQLSSQANNPYWAWKHDKISSVQRRIVANINAGYDFTDWLSVEYSLGYNNYTLDRKTLIDKGSRGYAGKGYINKGNSTDDNLESTAMIDFHKDFNGFGIKAILGHNYYQNKGTSFSATGLEIINKGIYAIDNTNSQVAGESYVESRKWGIFLDANLSWKNWAFLDLSGRMDKSSTLPVANNTYFYPAVSGSFIFTEAFGIQDSFINFGKVRASWAKVGNDASPYYNNGTYSVGSPYMGQGQMGLPSYLVDENLKPEFTTEFEAGLEFKLFNGRIGFDGTFYNRVSDNQIGSKTSPYSTGYTSLITNFGSIRNRGFEVGLDLYPVVVKDFSWNIYTIFTQNKSEVLSLADGVEKLEIGGDFSNPRPVLIVGQPYGILEGETLARTPDGQPLVDPSTGMYINNPDYGIIGDPNPEYKIAMTNTFRWKGISLSFLLDFQKGGCVYSSYLSDLLGRGVSKDTEDRLGGRIIPGVYGDANTCKPLLDENGNYIKNTTTISESDLWFSDGTYSTFAINSCDEVQTYDATVLRLRELSLGWQMPAKWFRKVRFIQGAELSVVGRNLWFWAPNVPKYSNYDPSANTYGDTNVQGIDYTSAPSTRRVAFNVKVTF